MLHTQPVSGIVQYLKDTHHPRAIIITGSYADGSCNDASDFDCWLIGADETKIRRDTSTVNGVELQAEIYPLSQMMNLAAYQMNYFTDVVIAHDPEGLAEAFMAQVQKNLSRVPCMPPAQKRQAVAYLDKMMRRARKQDFHGDLRGHLLLVQSVRYWCDFTDRLFLGMKKTLRMMERVDPESAALFRQALRRFAIEDIQAWIDRLHVLCETGEQHEYRIL